MRSALLCLAFLLANCGGSGPTTQTGAGNLNSCTAEYTAPSGGKWSAICDDVSGTCDCFYNGTKTSVCTQAKGGCYPDGGPSGATCCAGIPQIPR
jgi:hypothetical protein